MTNSNAVELPAEDKLVSLGHGLNFLQKQDAFAFGCDGVELANFVEGGSKDRAVDLGSGTGIITVLLAGKRKIRTTAVEIQPELGAACARNIELNHLESLADVIVAPMQNIAEHLPAGYASIVVCNPPYRKLGSGMRQQSSAIAIARHEVMVTLKEVIAAASYLLGTGGKFYMINQVERLPETLSLLIEAKLEPKKLQILTPNEVKKPHLFMVKCQKEGNPGLIIERERPVKTEVD